MKRRVGQFLVSDGFEDHPALRAILGRCDVIRREYDAPNRQTRYVAYSPDFEPTDMAGEPPLYDWMIHARPDGTSTVEAVRYVPDPEISARTAELLRGLFD
jgi:hypothetical protein